MFTRNTNINSNYNYDYKIQLKKNRNYVVKTIELGIELMRKKENLTEQLLSDWVDYTEEVLKICVGNSQSNIYIRFLELKIKIEIENEKEIVKPDVKISNYIEYLFKVVKAYDEM